MVITLSVWYTAFRATTRLKNQEHLKTRLFFLQKQRNSTRLILHTVLVGLSRIGGIDPFCRDHMDLCATDLMDCLFFHKTCCRLMIYKSSQKHSSTPNRQGLFPFECFPQRLWSWEESECGSDEHWSQSQLVETSQQIVPLKEANETDHWVGSITIPTMARRTRAHLIPTRRLKLLQANMPKLSWSSTNQWLSARRLTSELVCGSVHQQGTCD